MTCIDGSLELRRGRCCVVCRIVLDGSVGAGLEAVAMAGGAPGPPPPVNLPGLWSIR